MHEFLKDFDVILASQSPRRKDILNQIGLTNFQQITSPFDEETFTENFKNKLSPEEFLKQCSAKKNEAIVDDLRSSSTPKYGNKPKKVIISADTMIVDKNGQLFGKPKNRQEAIETLSKLKLDILHKVATNVTITLCDCSSEATKSTSFLEETKIYFNQNIDQSDIESYVDSGEPFGKAGGYGIQAMGALLIEKIEGDYLNVVGLPASKMMVELKKLIETF